MASQKTELNQDEVKKFKEWMEKKKNMGKKMRRTATKKMLLIKKAIEAGLQVSDEEVEAALKARL